MTSKLDKGKGRALSADERTPLLSQTESQSSSSSTGHELTTTSSRARRTGWIYRLLVGSLVLLTLSFIAIIALLLLAGLSYAQPATNLSLDTIIARQAVVFKGPTKVDVISVTHDAITVQLEALAGIDADQLLELTKHKGGWLAGARTSFGRWATSKLHSVTVSVTPISLYSPYSRVIHGIPKDPLITLSAPSFTIPLTTRRPNNDDWLTPLSLPLTIKPNQHGNALLNFADNAWKMNRVLVRAEVDRVAVVGSDRGWRSMLSVEKTNLDLILKYDFPPSLPGIPSNSSIAQLVTLESYSLHPIPPSAIGLSAEASLLNPLPSSIHGGLGFSLPFTISLLSSTPSNAYDNIPQQAPIARVTTAPISLTHPNISLSLSGTVLPMPPSSLPLLSQFLSNYLSGQSSPILITTPPPFSASLHTVFPGPNPKPQIIRHVTIRQMKIYADQNGTALLTSGLIIADIALPENLSELDVDVLSILPDVLVFDGPPPDETEEGDGGGGVNASFRSAQGPDASHVSPPPIPAPPLPTPLPPGAFARIRPRAWLNATSEKPPPGYPEEITTIVTAEIKDVPLDILPGRDKLFSSFVGKIVFKGSAQAGVRGDAAVGIKVQGLAVANGAEMALSGLPVQGVFMIKRGDVLHSPKLVGSI